MSVLRRRNSATSGRRTSGGTVSNRDEAFGTFVHFPCLAEWLEQRQPILVVTAMLVSIVGWLLIVPYVIFTVVIEIIAATRAN